MADQAATLEILIQIRDELAGLNRTREGIKETKKEADSLGAVLRSGFGIGTGMELARRGIDLLRNTLSESVGEAFRLAEEIRDQTQALNLSTEAYQVLRYELGQAGVDSGRLTMALSAQTQSLAAARVGAGEAAEAYKTLGLRASEVEQMRPEQRLAAVARATLSATDKTKAFQAAGLILGQRGLPQLLNALRGLAEDGYDKVAESAKKAGQVMSEDTAKRLDDAKKNIERLKNSITIDVGNTIAGADMIRQSAQKAPGQTLWGLMKWGLFGPTGAGDLAMTVAKNVPAPAKETPVATPTGPIIADKEKNLVARLGVSDIEASRIQNSALLSEYEKRRAMVPILDRQLKLYTELAKVQFGPNFNDERTRLGRAADAGTATEEELTRLQKMEELETKIRDVRMQRMESVDTPLLAISRQLEDSAGVANDIFSNSLNAGMSSLVSNLTAVAMGTGKLGDIFKSFKQIAIQALMELMVKLMIIKPLLAAFGIGGAATSVAPGAVKAVGVVAGGGGSFLTSGPTNFTVGDNPGGVELVNVTPLSGIGQTTVGGKAVRMAGGGSAIVAGRGALGGGDVFNFNYAFNGGVSREEVLGMLPTIVQASKSAVLDAKRRRRDGFR